MIVKEIEYQKHRFKLTRKIYIDLPEELKVTEVGQVIQQADNPYEEEFIVIRIKDDEVWCRDVYTNLDRFFYLDSVRISEKELKRIKRAKILSKKSEAKRKRQEKEQKRTQRTLEKLKRESDKKNRKLKFKKEREVIIKFV